jgi:outer membrane protein assembly complex protein YaeT
VRALKFQGNREFDAATLAASIATTPTSFAALPIVGTKRCLDPVEFARDVQRLEVLYRRRGYPEVDVDTVVRVIRPQVIEVTFRIREGTPMIVSKITASQSGNDPEVTKATNRFTSQRFTVFDRAAFEAGRDSLLRDLRNAGWPQAEVLLAYETNNAEHKATLEATVIPGIRAKLGTISVVIDSSNGSGLSEGTIRRTMGLNSGDWFSARAIIDAQRNLYQTDGFRRVDLQPDSIQPPGDSIVNMTVTLVQGNRFSARGGIGWATLDCARLQGTLTNRDFIPYAERMVLEARVSKVGIGAPLDGAPRICQKQAIEDPYSKELNYYAGLTLGQSLRSRPSLVPAVTVYSSVLSEFKAYLRRTPIGGAMTFTNPLQQRYPSQFGYQVEIGRTEAEPAFFCAVFNACEVDARSFLQQNNRLAALNYSITRATVDNPLRPSSGTTVRLELRHASPFIGSSSSQRFNKAVVDGTWYFGIGNTAARVTSHVRVGQVYGGTDFRGTGFVPPQERLYAGGPTTVRGFRQNEMGPSVYIVGNIREVPGPNGETYIRSDSGARAERVVPTGGNSLVVGNLELQLPSPVLSSLLQWAVFTDAGRLWNRNNSSTDQTISDDGRQFKVTPGAGIRIASPFGAIRIDFGYNAYRQPKGAAYFNAPVGAGNFAPLYCVSPTNTLPVTTNPAGLRVQAAGACPATFAPPGNKGFLRRFNPSIWIGQAF